MNQPTEATAFATPASTGQNQITDKKTRYSAGVLKYRQMGYWDADYVPKDTDTLDSIDQGNISVGKTCL